MSILVFGGSGFIGRHLVEALSSRSSEEILIADIQSPAYHLSQAARYQYCDVRHPIHLDLSPRLDLVVNLAARAREPGYPDQDYYDTNAGGAENIVRYCEEVGAERIWFTSSMSVYGPSELPCYEDSPKNPQTPYGKSKLMAEEVHCRWYARQPGRRLLMVRPAVIFGAGEGGNFTNLARSLKRGLFVYPGRRDTIKACGYVEELIRTMFFMDGLSDAFLLYNFSYPQPYTIQDICETFVKVAGFRRPFMTVPKFVMLAAARIFQALNLIGLKNAIHPLRIHKLVRSTNIYPGELLKRGYAFQTDLELGLRRWLDDPPSGLFV